MESEVSKDLPYIQKALTLASGAAMKDEVPVGAVIVLHDRIIAQAYNQTEMLHDCTAHAEMIALTAAQAYLNSRYLTECTLYVTLEPCSMCAGALYWSQIGRVVYSASDEKRGYTLYTPMLLHPKTKISKGLMSAESEILLKTFFINKRS